MNMHQSFQPSATAAMRIGFGEFVAMVAALMALTCPGH
jgi:hypothetical protein